MDLHGRVAGACAGGVSEVGVSERDNLCPWCFLCLLLAQNAWQLLARAALQRGHPVLVESAYQKLKEFERLSFLYFITGHIGKLRKMLRIAELRKDPMSRFHNALLLGDAEERVQILAEVGQLALAALTAKTYGLKTLYDQLQENVRDMQIEPFLPAVPQLLMPPVPIIR